MSDVNWWEIAQWGLLLSIWIRSASSRAVERQLSELRDTLDRLERG